MADSAWLMGINTYQSVSDLRRCLNDVANVHRLLVETFGFSPDHLVRLVDGQVVNKNLLEEYLDLDPAGCGFLEFRCAHGASFDEGNVEVKRDMFARLINET